MFRTATSQGATAPAPDVAHVPASSIRISISPNVPVSLSNPILYALISQLTSLMHRLYFQHDIHCLVLDASKRGYTSRVLVLKDK